MRDFNPEQQYEDGSFREIAPRGYPDVTANEWDDLTPLEELVVAECKATYLRVRPARLPLVGAWMDRILERLPRQQTFATAADLAAWLSAQYREQQRQCPTWPHHWCDMMLIRELAFERYADAAADGRSYARPRPGDGRRTGYCEWCHRFNGEHEPGCNGTGETVPTGGRAA